MAHTAKHKKARIVLIVFEILAVLLFLFGSVPVFNSGNIAGAAVTGSILLITLFWYKTAEFRHSRAGKRAKWTALFGIAAAVILGVALQLVRLL